MHDSPEIAQDYLYEHTGYTWHTIPWSVLYELCCSSVYWLCYFLNFKPTPQQMTLLDLVEQRVKRIACKSGQGPGKTTCSTIIGIWWTMRVVNTRVLLTAPSMKLCRDVFLAEARKQRARAHPLLQKFFRVSKSRVLFGGEKYPNWQIIPVTAGQTDSVGMQGQHDDNMNIIIEEASGVSRPVFEALEGTASNTKSEYTPDAEECSILAIGNPNQVGTPFHDCFTSERGDGVSQGWRCLTFNAEQSPIVSKKNIERIARRYGVNSDVYRVRVLGEFPRMDPQGIVALEDLEHCIHTSVRETLLAFGGRKQIGIDIARQGGDEFVAVFRQGGCVVDFKIWHKVKGFEPADAIRWIFVRQIELGWSDSETVYVFDAGGMGQGVIHLFRDANKNYHTFHTQGRAFKTREFTDKMSEAFFHFAWKAKTHNLHLPDDGLMFAQLTNRHYTIKEKDSSIKVESKDDYKKRTEKPSPDRADAMVMAFYDVVGSRGRIAKKSNMNPTVGISKWVDR